MNIYVGNLASDVKDDELKTLFSQHGRVDSVKIVRDMFSQTSKGFGFVEMPGRAEAEKALSALNTYELKGKKLVVNEARPKKERGSGGGRRRSY
jgi:RNA recognition motif-containing protein